MISPVDILFIITVGLLVFNGFRNGAVISLVNLVSIPLGLLVAYLFGPGFTGLLANNGLPATPLISYVVLFFGTVFLLHIIGTVIRGVVKGIPLLGFGDALLGAVVGFVEAWILWVVLLFILGNFLHSASDTIKQGSTLVPGLNIKVDQLQSWIDFYNSTVTNSLFAKVNSFILKTVPNIPTPKPQH